MSLTFCSKIICQNWSTVSLVGPKINSLDRLDEANVRNDYSTI